MNKKHVKRVNLKKSSRNEMGKVVPLRKQEVFRFYTQEKFLEAMAYARELYFEDMERQAAEAAKNK